MKVDRMKIARIVALGFVSTLIAWGTAVPATATTADPCNAPEDFIGTELPSEDLSWWASVWSNLPMHVKGLCADKLTVDEVFFSETAQTKAEEVDTFSRDAVDGFGQISYGPDFLADSWSLNGQEITAESAFDRGTDIQNITATLTWAGNTLTWTVDNLQGGIPSNALDFNIRGDLGSDENTTIVDMGNGIWVTHDANAKSDPVLVWRAVGATLVQEDPNDYPDAIEFQWTEESSVELQVIVVPGVQCYTGELDENGDRVPEGDQANFEQTLAFATDTVAANYEEYAGDTIDPIGDLSCGANLAETGTEIAPMGFAAFGALAIGSAAVYLRRRRS